MKHPSWFLRLVVAVGLTFIIAAGIHPAPAAERAALVIGCGKYRAEGVPELSTPVNDARKMAAALRAAPLSFEVIEAADSTRNQFFEKLDEFKSRARGAKVVLVYFSGHGIEADGLNYLIPVDAVLEKPSHLESEAVPLSRILETMQSSGAEAKVAVLDACRNNPFGRTKSWHSKGASEGVLAALGDAQLPEATLVCFAAAPGRKAAAALDDSSQNSPFTEFLLRRLETPGARLRDVFESTADDVAQATKNRQLPYVKYDGSASVLRQLVLIPATTTATAAVSPVPSRPPSPPPSPATGPGTSPPATTSPAKTPAATETARLDVPKPPAMTTTVPPSVPNLSTADASLGEKISLLAPVKLPALPFQYFLAPELKAQPAARKLALKLITQKANSITDEESWFVRNGLERVEFRIPETPRTKGTNWIKGTKPLPAVFPLTYRAHTLIIAVPNPNSTILLYHEFPERPRYLVAVDGARGLPSAAFDFENSAFSPKTKDKQFARQGVNWAEQQGDIMYVSRGLNGYAKDAGGQTAYLFAWSLSEQKLLWNSQPVVCNSENFLIVGDVILCGYGFSGEPDYLYQISRRTGAVLDTIKLKSSPEYLVRKNGKLFVRTYDTDYVFECPAE